MRVRSGILQTVVLLLLVGPVWSALSAAQAPPISGAAGSGVPLPLPGENSVSNLVVTKGRFDQWTADFDYYFTGTPSAALISLELTPQSGASVEPSVWNQYAFSIAVAERGAHHLSTPIRYPGKAQRTIRVTVLLRGSRSLPNDDSLASQKVDQVIDWPDAWTAHRNDVMATHSAEESLKQAVGLIDTEIEQQQLEARAILEALIAENPRFEGAYIELARIAMKTNWGPAGLHHAEELLNSALQINPKSVDAKILLGYVYAHQTHFAKAETLFADAAAATTNKNLWLWSNWGELLDMEGKPDEAIGKYREAITHPMTHDSSDRARVFAYRQLIGLLRARSDLDGMEALYKQQVEEFGPGTCYSADYSRFLLDVRGDAQAAINLSTRALNQNCNDSESREILGLAQYVKWATTAGPQSEEALNQAHLFLPTGPKAFYGLASNERSLLAAKKLIAAGEEIDQKDNDQMTALAYALQDHDVVAAGRLLKLGASPETPIGVAQMPVALMSVLAGDVDAVRLLRENGVNFSMLKYQGVSALDLAQRSGNRALLDALGSRQAQL